MTFVSINKMKVVPMFHSNSIPIHKMFRPIFISLHVLGIETLMEKDTTIPKNNKVVVFLSRLPKFVTLLLCSSEVGLTLKEFIQNSLTKFAMVEVLTLIFTTFTYISLFRSRKQFNSLIEQLSAVSKLKRTQTIKFQVIISIAFFFFAILLLVYSFSRYIYVSARLPDAKSTDANKTLIVATLDMIIGILYVFHLCFTYLSFVLYYCLVCEILRLASARLKDRIHSDSIQSTYAAAIRIHFKITTTMKSLDDAFSSMVFQTIVTSMYFSFWGGYMFLINDNPDSSLAMQTIIITVVSLMFMIPLITCGSRATESAAEARRELNALPALLPNRHREIDVLLRGGIKYDIRLTLWKMFDIKRSLIISIFGTLVTYGIIIGSNQNRK